MPRNSAGTFTLVPGNPVQSGDVVSSTWANSTLDDVADALTDSLDREGRGGMLAPFRFADGTNLLPGASWVNENTTGFYRFDGGDLRVSVLTQDVMRWQNTGAQVWNSTDSQWENILSGNSVPAFVNAGTAESQTLRWDNTGEQWLATDTLSVSTTTVTVNGTLLSPGAGTNSFRAGLNAGSTTQGASSVAVGNLAGNSLQATNAVAVGREAGRNNQDIQATAVGYYAGKDDQGNSGVAVGNSAGQTTQGTNSVAVGKSAGMTSQSNNSVAMGNLAGNDTQGASSVAVGTQAGQTTQGTNSVSVGNSAGKTTQGSSSVAVGRGAGETNQGDNGIIINASGVALDDTTAGHIHIASDDGSLDFTTAGGWTMSADLDVTGNVVSNRHSIPSDSSVLGRMDFTGYTVGTTEHIGARVVGKTSQAWGASQAGTRLEFETTPNGSLTSAVAMTLGADGTIANTGDVNADGLVTANNGVLVGATEIGTPTQAAVSSITTVTQAEYDAIVTPDANTLYVII